MPKIDRVRSTRCVAGGALVFLEFTISLQLINHPLLCCGIVYSLAAASFTVWTAEAHPLACIGSYHMNDVHPTQSESLR